MPLPVIPNVYRVAWNWSFAGGQSAVNVLNFHDETAGTLDETDLEIAMNAHANSSMFYGVADGASVTVHDIIKLDGASPTKSFVPLTPANWDGGTGGQPMPAVAGLVSLHTAIRGPRGRGRIYLPFWSEGEANAGFWNSGANRATCQAAWEAFLAAMAGDDWALQVASYAHATTQDVTSVVVRNALATQRRRQRRLQ